MRFRTGTESPLTLLTRRMRHVLRCSFCGKSEHEVKKLVAGPRVYICDHCVEICNQVMADADTSAAPTPSPK